MTSHTLDRLRSRFTAAFPGDTIRQCTPLAGQASSRQYFRVHSQLGNTYVLMQLPAESRSISEEAMSGAPPAELPFIDVHRYLKQTGIAVPEIYFYLEEEGQLLLEDIGDQNLDSLVRGTSPEFVLFYYKQAIDALVDWQEKSRRRPDPTHISHTRAFTFDLLLWECVHFLEYGVEDFFKIKIPPQTRQAIDAEFERLCHELTALPYCLVHRDFQSRNLHLHGYRFKCIDFQDALQGPYVYDLVALLRDSYIVLPPAILAELKDDYWQKIKKPELTRSNFDRAFHLQTLQRKLKDTGRFQYIHTVKHNDQFLPYRTPSLGYVREALAGLPDYHRLADFLAPWIADDGLFPASPLG